MAAHAVESRREDGDDFDQVGCELFHKGFGWAGLQDSDFDAQMPAHEEYEVCTES